MNKKKHLVWKRRSNLYFILLILVYVGCLIFASMLTDTYNETQHGYETIMSVVPTSTLLSIIITICFLFGILLCFAVRWGEESEIARRKKGGKKR